MATSWRTNDQLEGPSLILGTLRDEIRVRLHLASMEARQKWQWLDVEGERLLHRAARISKKAIDELIGKLQELRRSLDSH
jgi:hypothetical protein